MNGGTSKAPEPFPSAALDTNRVGALTGAQRAHLLGLSRGLGKRTLSNVGVALVAGAIVVVGATHRFPTVPPILIAAAVVVFGGFLLTRIPARGSAMARDLRDGRVESLDGAIGKREGPYTGGPHYGYRPHYLTVGDETFRVSRTAYDAAPDAAFVRVYFLPRSREIVNLERLPDRPLSRDTTPTTLAHQVMDAVRSPDRRKFNELRAEIAAGFTQSPVPPPSGRDPRPLDEAIIGTWTNGLMTVAFASDGSVTATMFGGVERRGHWSVDGSGRLRADVTGQQEAADAWVAGDRLTIAADGQGLTFTRKP